MRHILREVIGIGAIIICLATASPASAQDPTLPQPNILPPPPPPPPPPKVELPKIPKIDEIPSPPGMQLPRRGSFSDRVSRCIDEGSRLGPNERTAYTGACANR